MPFADIVGHRGAVALLASAVARGSLPPSLLLTGDDGVGKRTVALAVAQAINCAAPRSGTGRDQGVDLAADACGRCGPCARIGRDAFPDVRTLVPGETGTIAIDAVRAAIEQAGYRPFEGRRRVVVIDQADRLLPPAQNALLKVLEEPPAACQFLLVTSRPDVLLDTVRSRCPRIRFGQLAPEEVVRILTASHGWDEAAARASAAAAGGSVGRALAAASGEHAAAREAAVSLLESTAAARTPRARIEAAKTLASRSGGRRAPAADRDALRLRLEALASLLRDMEVIASRAGAPLANDDLGDGLRRLARAYRDGRGLRAFAAVDEAAAAVARNASPKIVADWLACRL
ncbi:MAG: AAA family ATPase [Acidobacteria bacterium]|nr:AAA family ATPase [Acidobacteriota bacterium]